MKTMMVATLLLSTAAPAMADYDYDDYIDDLKDNQRDYRRSMERQQRAVRHAYRNGYGINVAPRYYGGYYNQSYPYNNRYYSGGRGRSIVHGILNSIF